VVIDLASSGFVVANEWYWRLSESGCTLSARVAVDDFIAPIARLARGTFAIDADVVEDELRMHLAERELAIRIPAGVPDRVAVGHLVNELNRAFAAAEVGQAFLLAVPRRYELRGMLVPVLTLDALARNPLVVLPKRWPRASAVAFR